MVARGADYLRGGTHRVGILDLDLLLTGEEVRTVDHRADVGRRGHRPAEAAQLVQAGVVGLHVGAQGFEAHRAGDLRLFEPALDVPHRQAADGIGQVGAVDDCQTVAGLEPRHRDPRGVEGLGSGHPGTLVESLALAHHEEGNLAHRREVAAGADRPLLADHRGDAGVEHRDERLGDLGPAAGVAVGVDVDP